MDAFLGLLMLACLIGGPIYLIFSGATRSEGGIGSPPKFAIAVMIFACGLALAFFLAFSN